MTSQLNSFLDSFNSGHLVINAKREIFYSNQYMVNLLGCSQDVLTKMSLSEVFSKASNIFIDSYVYPLLINELCVEELQLTLITSEGKKIPVVVNIKLDEHYTTYWSLFDCANRDKLYQELIQAKELLEVQSEELLEMVTVDSLTGLLNRRELDNRASKALSQARRSKLSVAVIVIDIDFFKKINDTYGHSFGDETLKHLGKILLSRQRENDVVARFGGEEFVLILMDIDKKNAFNFAESLRMTIEETKINGINITVSIGISLNSEHANQFEALFKEADTALFKAKASGRNKTILF
ncbi:MAG: diguanylate cyclase (GGDEF)-like protein [Oleispira sp.]|jgi:diguanylate cyclase (GGDEF)-like protein